MKGRGRLLNCRILASTTSTALNNTSTAYPKFIVNNKDRPLLGCRDSMINVGLQHMEKARGTETPKLNLKVELDKCYWLCSRVLVRKDTWQIRRPRTECARADPITRSQSLPARSMPSKACLQTPRRKSTGHIQSRYSTSLP